jgi:hypothetical protein
MPNASFVDATESRVLEVLSSSGLLLDATQIAERASVPPADAASALRRLADKDIVQVARYRHDEHPRYAAL